jgi:AAHS family 4-hydroxybenzoate transporter-like MFS transporter
MSAGRSRIWILVLAALAFLAEGIGTQAMGLALPVLLHDWHLPRAALATPTALGLVGFALGAVGGGFAGDRFGAVRALLGALVLMGLGTAGCALAQDVAQLGAWRILAGLGLGASLPIGATVIADFSPEGRRPLALSIGLGFLPIGGFIAGELASFLVPAFGWRALFLVCGSVAIVLALIAGVGRAGVSRAALSVSTAGRERAPRGSMTLRLGASVRDTLGLWFAFFFTVLLYYSMFSWAPTAFTARGLPVAAVSRLVSVFSIGGLIGGVASGALVQWLGSRVSWALLGAGTFACALTLPHVVPSDASGSLTPLAATIALLGVAVIGIQSLLYALGAEVYPLAHRATGLGLAVGCGRVGAIVSSYTGVIALDRSGLEGFSASLALAALLALAAGLSVSRQIRGRLGARLKPVRL